jgi:plastocyanin
MIKTLLGVLLLLPAAAVDETYSVTGTLKLGGPKPAPRVNKRLADTPACCALHKEPPLKDDLVVDDHGGVRWGFLWIKKGVKGEFSPPAEAVLIDQVGCVYTPHVAGAMVGQKVTFRNSDDFMHNVRGMPFSSRQFNFGQPVKGCENDVTFSAQEVPVRIECNVHVGFVTSYIGVVEHPFFAVTDIAGNFEIKKLPAGNYTLGVWHERLTVPDLEIVVKGNHRVDLVGQPKGNPEPK